MKHLTTVFLAYVFQFILIVVLVLTVGLKYATIAVVSYLAFCVINTLIEYTFSMRQHFKKREKTKRGGYIYAFSDTGQILPVVKIGRESEKLSRLRQHRTSAPFGLRIWFTFKVADAVYVERYFHQRYRWMRYNKSSEWFFLTPKMWIELKLIGLMRR